MQLTAEEYRLLVEHSPVLIWRAGLDARCDYFNRTWLAFTGRTLAQEIGDGWVEGVHPDDLDRCVRTYRDHFERRQPFEMEYRLRRHDGVYRWIFDRGVPYDDARGQFAGYIGSCVDVDERRELERARDDFLTLLSHELRTPITALRTYVDAVVRHPEQLAVASGLGMRLLRQVDRLRELLSDLSDTTRLDRGMPLAMSMAPMELGEVVRHAGAIEQAVLDGRRTKSGHRVAIEVDEGPHPMIGDAGRIEQLLLGLLDNAIKFSPAGGEVRLGLGRGPGGYQLTVRDAGIGVPIEEVSTLGRRYFRASNVDPNQFPGLGIGLTICREIVASHGGRIQFDSVLGEGTTVRIDLPAEPPAPDGPGR